MCACQRLLTRPCNARSELPTRSAPGARRPCCVQEQGRAAAHEVQMTQREIQEHLLPVLPPVKVGGAAPVAGRAGTVLPTPPPALRFKRE